MQLLMSIFFIIVAQLYYLILLNKIVYSHMHKFFCILFLCLSLGSKAQHLLVADSILLVKKVAVSKEQYTGLHAFYKKFISSQDGDVCTFYPSCSSFSKGAFHKNGFLAGLFLTADRLCRCNGHNEEYYEYDGNRDKLIDFP
jgi:putative component of membrane protein insertase Oxa1/YidC/SpoIIIJ protein YidD